MPRARDAASQALVVVVVADGCYGEGRGSLFLWLLDVLRFKLLSLFVS
jgi:hypothetical protein